MRIGIDLGGTKIEGLALDDHGRELARRRIPTPRGDYPATVKAVQELVTHLEQTTGQRGSVGLGIPGAISPATGLVKNANSVWLIGQPFDRDLSQALGRPVRVANDANCFALSEATDGAAAGAAVVFGVILGTGTGGGLVVNGRVVTGANAVAGEWGHNPLPWPREDELPGPPCYCGKRGCLETFLAGPSVARDHAAHAGGRGDTLGPEQVVRLAEQGDAAAQATLDRHVDRLARGLASIINVLDPQVIVLGGGLSKLSHLYRHVPERWGRYVFSDQVATSLRPPMHGDASGVRGAAFLWER